MRLKVAISMMVVLALAACQGRERATVTGGYGTSVLSGVVVMGDGGTPEGVNVTVAGTGMAMLLAADGKFAFAGAPGQAELRFDRAADGILASLHVEAAKGPVVVELAKNGAKSGRRRGAGSGNPLTQFEGLVRSISATEVVVFTSKKVEQAIAITPQTVIRRGNALLTPADVTVDQRVHVKAIKSDTGFNAFLIIVQGGEEEDGSPEAREFEGLVVTSSAEQLVIIDSRAVQQTFVLTATTVIRKGNTPVLATAIQPGWRVHVKATTAADGLRTATRVIVQRTHGDDGGGNGGDKPEVKLSGRVTGVAASSLTVETDDGTVTVQTDASTKIEKKGDDVPLASIVAGDRVKVEGTRIDATTVLAKEIEVK